MTQPASPTPPVHPAIAALLATLKPGEPHVHNGFGLWSLFAPARFLVDAAKTHETQHDTPGLGRDHRLRFRYGHGAALRVDDTIVHLALFGGGGASGHPAEPRILRRHSDRIG